MRRSLYAAVLALALAPAAPAFAAPPTCAELLGGRVYRCTVKTSFGTEFEDCFRTTRPGTRSAEFDLAADRLREPFGCTCEPRGAFRRPRFEGSKRFLCTGGGTTGSLATTLGGRVSRRGDRIRSGKGGNDAGDSFVFQCRLDSACVLP